MGFNKETGMYEGYIYKIYNDINNKVYIGQTITTIDKRFSQHISDANHKNINSRLYNAIRKYGEQYFHISEIKKIERITKYELKTKLNELEIFYIDEYNSCSSEYGYNIDIGGNSNSSCYKQIDQYDEYGTKLKTWNSITDISDYYGITITSISDCCRGKSKSCIKYIWRYHNDSFDKFKNMEKVRVVNYDLSGNIIGIYNSISDAAREVYGDVSYVSAIVANCKGKYNICKGSVWRYEFDSFDKYSIENKSKYRNRKK